MLIRLPILSVILGGALVLGAPASSIAVVPVVQTYSDGTDGDQDDMCVWVHPTDLASSTIITTDKDNGTVYVYNLDGTVIQTLPSPQPGNIDVRYGFQLGSDCVDLVAFNERTENLIRVYRVNPTTRQLVRVDNGAIATPGGNYGFTLYRHSDGRLFAHTGPDGSGSVVSQYELMDNGSGQIAGAATGWQFDESTVEGMAGDDETGYLYFGEESAGVWRVDALDDTDKTLIAAVGDPSGLTSDVEGVTIYHAAGGAGYIIASSQGADKFTILNRQPPHAPVGEFSLTGVGNTDGIDVLNLNLGSLFPAGIFTAHNGEACCPVQAARWNAIAADVGGLTVDTQSWDPRTSNRNCQLSSTTTVAPPTTTTMPPTTTTLGGSGVSFVQAQTGVSSGTSTVATAGAVGTAAGHLLLAAVATRPHAPVTGISGLGLTWEPVASHCAGRNQTGIDLWAAQATAAAAGSVSATLTGAVTNAVIVVTSYAGASLAQPLGAPVTANSNGVAGACAGGIDATTYAFNLTTSAAGSVVHAAVAMRNRTHTPGLAYTERAEVSTGTAGAIASAAAQDRTVVAAANVLVDGTLSGAVDWAAVAVEVRALGTLATTTTTTTSTTTTTTSTTTSSSTTTTTLVPGLCAPNPLPAAVCRGTPLGLSVLGIDNGSRPGLGWKWRNGSGTEPASFGDPTMADQQHRICVYDASTDAPLHVELALRTGAVCAGQPCWRTLAAGGYAYRDTTALPHGVRTVKLRANGDGRAKIKVRARGENVPSPVLPPAGFDLPVVIQFVIDLGTSVECWESSFSAADQNDGAGFAAYNP